MKSLFVAALVSMIGLSASADVLSTVDCSEQQANTTLNSLIEMRNYSNGAIKIFSFDHIEPAAAAFGLAITLDRGEDLASSESFCRYIPYLSSVSALSTIKSSYNASTNTLTLKLDVQRMNPAAEDPTSQFVTQELTIKIKKSAPHARDVVQVEAK